MSDSKLLDEMTKRIELLQLSTRTLLGDAEAKFRIAYLNTTGANPNYKEALEAFKKLATKNIPEAQYNLGVMYYNGEGVEKDNKTAKKWFKKAAEQGLKEAESILTKL